MLDAEELERATVWGYSRGGWLACHLATAHPERVARIAIGGFGSHAHEAEVPLLSGWVEHLGRGDWDGFWRTFGVQDRTPLKPIEEENDPQAVAAAWPVHCGRPGRPTSGDPVSVNALRRGR